MEEPDLFEFRALLYRASHAQRQLMHPFMASIGLGTGQPKLLSYLDEHGPSAPRDLAEYYELDPAGVSRMLDTLAKRGLVTIAPAEGDRRSKVVSLTAEGKRVSQSWAAACREEAAAMLKGFAPEERVAFADYLVRAHANLRAYGQKLVSDAKASAAAGSDSAPAADAIPSAGPDGQAATPAVASAGTSTPATRAAQAAPAAASTSEEGHHA